VDTIVVAAGVNLKMGSPDAYGRSPRPAVGVFNRP